MKACIRGISMLLIYSPDDSNIYGSRGGEFEGAVKLCS